VSVNKKHYNDFIQGRGQYATVPNELWELPGLDLPAKAIWCYILSRSPNWTSSRNNVARNLTIHPVTASKYLRQLEERRLLRIVTNPDGSWDFEILPPSEWTNPPVPEGQANPVSDGVDQNGSGSESDPDQNGSGSESDPVPDQILIHTQEATMKEGRGKNQISEDFSSKPLSPAKDPVGTDTGLGDKNSETNPERALFELFPAIDEVMGQKKYLGELRALILQFATDFGEVAIPFDRVRERIEFHFPARRKNKDSREACANAVDTAREAHEQGLVNFKLAQMRKAQPEFKRPESQSLKPATGIVRPKEQARSEVEDDSNSPLLRFTVDLTEQYSRMSEIEDELEQLHYRRGQTEDTALLADIDGRILNLTAELESLEKETDTLLRENRERRELARGEM
jgi:hypothetical protein